MPAGIRSMVCMATATAVAAWLVVTPARADTAGDVRQDGDFLRSLQLGDGAIVSDVRRILVEPYVANYAAWGLARAARTTGDRAYFDAAVRWLSWYQDHMDPDGIVHDYVVRNGKPEVTDDEDSVDATSGTFLLALREAYIAAPPGYRRHLLQRFHTAIRGAVGAIEALRDVDGLTWAKASWHVKYLMDNAEAYGGLRAAHELATALGDGGLAADASSGATRAKDGMSGLWNPETEAYDWAEHADGFRQPTQWAMLYPDAVEQAWAVAYEVVDPPRSRELMGRFTAAQPNWDRPTATATYWDGQPYAHPVGFWPLAGWALSVIGESGRAEAAAARIRQAALDTGRQPPFTAGTQGQLIVLVTGGPAAGSDRSLKASISFAPGTDVAVRVPGAGSRGKG